MTIKALYAAWLDWEDDTMVHILKNGKISWKGTADDMPQKYMEMQFTVFFLGDGDGTIVIEIEG